MLKKIISVVCCLVCIQGAYAVKYEASGTSSPSPLNLAGKGTITITPAGDLGDDVYIYSWCGIYAGQSGYSMTWQDAIADKYRMTRNADGSYSYVLTRTYQDWFKLTDEQCAGLEQIGVIARNTTDQTVNVYIDCIYKEEFFSGGIGTVNDPYQIQCASDLEYLAANNKFWSENTHFVQTASIELDRPINPIGSEKVPFMGCYDGRGYSIAGLIVKSNPGTEAGLFGVAVGAEIDRVVLVDCEVKGAGYVGSLVGRAKDCVISQSLSSQGEVQSRLLATGGLVGFLEGGTISDCYSSTDVFAPAEKAVGGLLGKNTGKVINSYATGRISAADYAGGLIGANYGTVVNSAAINGSIEASGKFVGRFGGNNNSLNVSEGNFAWIDIPCIAQMTWSDFSDHAVRPDLSPNVKSTYSNSLHWDFDNVWFWKDGDECGYPELRMVKESLPSPLPEVLVSDIPTLTCDDTHIEKVYNLQGIFMGHSLDELPAGIYIVKTKTSVYKIVH